MMGPIANAICLCFIDKVGRKLPLAWTSVALVIDMILIMVFTKYFAESDNKVGQGFTIAWMFIFSLIFSLGFVDRIVFSLTKANFLLVTTPFSWFTLRKSSLLHFARALQPVRLLPDAQVHHFGNLR